MMKIAILGSGTWGTALANLLASKKYQVYLWSKFEQEINQLKKDRRHKNLPNCVLDEKINYSTNVGECIKSASIIVFAVPSIFVRDTAKLIKPFIDEKQIIVDVAKGIESDTLLTMSEVISDELHTSNKVVALSGPTHAEEVAIKLPTLIVSACRDLDVAKVVQEVFSTNYFRVYTNQDVLGVELSGALKNIIALASGISSGLGYGDNAIAAIVTRGLSEITRLGLAMGCKEETFAGLTGIGDIVVTATSRHSRNNKAGYLLGQGHDVEMVLKEVGMVVEGINALKAAMQLKDKYQIELPIIEAVYNVVYNHQKPLEAVNNLFNRKLKSETKKG